MGQQTAGFVVLNLAVVGYGVWSIILGVLLVLENWSCKAYLVVSAGEISISINTQQMLTRHALHAHITQYVHRTYCM